jgi:DNA polymerase-1
MMANCTPDFLRYNALDACCTLEIHNSIWDDLNEGYHPANDMTIALLDPLIFMMSRGIAIEHEALEITKNDITRSINEKQAELDALCGRPLNVNSPKDCQRYFYIELGITPYYNQGRVTVDDSALQRLCRGTAKRPPIREAKLVQDIRGLQKLFGTYLDIEFDQDGRMRCSYNPRGTKFGRLSSSKTIFGTGTNQQNLPQEFKKFLVADPGYVLWEVDKRQAEWVVVAYLTGDANMISVVESGMDAHIHTASLMFKCDKETIAKEAKLIGNNSDSDIIERLRTEAGINVKYPRTMSMRQCGKKSNHGLNYDEGPNTFALLNELEQTEAKVIVELYHSIYPGIRIWYESVKRQLQKDRSLTNCFGRKVRFMDSWGPDLWKAAYSMLPQSTVVDSLNQGMCKVYADKWITQQLNVDLLAQVHDSILMQVPIEVAYDAEKFNALKETVYDYVSPELCYNNRKFKLNTDSKMGLNWSGFHPDHNPDGMQELTNDNYTSVVGYLNARKS